VFSTLPPCLDLSYHDNDHYNSVRQTNGKNPPHPIKIMPKKSKQNTNAPSEEATSTDDSSNTTETAQTSISVEAESLCSNEAKIKGRCKVKRRHQCPCGSGVKYKECCRKKEINTKCGTGRESSGDDNSKSTTSSKMEEPEDKSEIDGLFRMLKI
jgi:uncharacterized protein YchJ